MFANKAAKHGPGEEGGFFVFWRVGAVGHAVVVGEFESETSNLHKCGCGDAVCDAEHVFRILFDKSEDVPRIEDVAGHVVEFAADEEVRKRCAEAGTGRGECALA